MSEYTPTIEEVREFISKTVWPVAEFDHWLTSVKAEAWDEGKEYGEKRANREVHFQPNPYREGENSE